MQRLPNGEKTMKPSELLKEKCECVPSMHSYYRKTWARQYNKDNVVAYYQERFVTIVLLKGRGGHYGYFIKTNTPYNMAYCEYDVTRIGEKEILTVLGKNPVIVNEEEFFKFKSKQITDKL
jgi:hypothetical protein